MHHNESYTELPYCIVIGRAERALETILSLRQKRVDAAADDYLEKCKGFWGWVQGYKKAHNREEALRRLEHCLMKRPLSVADYWYAVNHLRREEMVVRDILNLAKMTTSPVNVSRSDMALLTRFEQAG